MTDREIDDAIDALLTITDPRGHDLLEVLRDSWKRYEQLLGQMSELMDALAGVDTNDHSKSAELRVVQGGKPV